MPTDAIAPLATFGALGIITAWLLAERYLIGAKERTARHKLADAITANTATVEQLVHKLTDLDRALWQFIITQGGPSRPPTRPLPHQGLQD
jgi:hypothetical protein